MEEKINGTEIIAELFEKRLKSLGELAEDYKKLLEYISPFIEAEDEIKSLSRSIQSKITAGLAADDMVLCTAVMADLASMRLFKPSFVCMKCGKSLLEEEEKRKEDP